MRIFSLKLLFPFKGKETYIRFNCKNNINEIVIQLRHTSCKPNIQDHDTCCSVKVPQTNKISKYSQNRFNFVLRPILKYYQ